MFTDPYFAHALFNDNSGLFEPGTNEVRTRYEPGMNKKTGIDILFFYLSAD